MQDPSLWVEDAEGWNAGNHYRERMTNGFSKADWINFNSYLAWVIANGVRMMKESGHTSFYYPDEPDENWEALTNAEYDVMIHGFEQFAAYERGDTEDKWEDIKRDLDDALELFKNRFTSLWD